MSEGPVIEICVEGFEEALSAEEAGADRVELCAGLMEGGITPSIAQIRLAKARLSIPVMVIIRPRGGDFLYSDAEFEAMLADIEVCKSAGADGVVIGFLNADGTVDIKRTKAAVAAAGSMRVTFHRAFDMTRNPEEALDALIGCGIERVLTSGQRPTAEDGAETLKALIARARERITILVCGDPLPDTLFAENEAMRGAEFHFGATAYRDSPMQYRNPTVTMGKTGDNREYQRRTIDKDAIARRKAALKAAWRR